MRLLTGTLLCWWGVFLFSAAFVEKSWLIVAGQQADLPISEVMALQSIYEAAGGYNWSWNQPYSIHGYPWNFTDVSLANPCQDEWQGIVCVGTQPNQVQLLSLINLNLVGSISAGISALSHLQELQIRKNNQLRGTIPPQIGNLSQLKSLDLDGNRLTGNIPPQVGNLAQLRALILDSNKLTGSIPPQIGNLTHLQALHLDGNQLTGSIPSQIGNLTQLKELTFYSNELTGSIPPQLGNLLTLISLGLGGNRLTGNIPPQVGNLRLLLVLKLQINELTGSIPPQIGNLTQLQVLDLDENELTGSIPPQIGNLAQLQVLELNENELTGSIPPQIGNLTQLVALYLDENELTGSIPQQIGNLSQLQVLELDENELTGSIPPQIGDLAQLQALYLDGNQLTGSIPPQIGNLTHLQALYLSSNGLTGSIPTQLVNLTQLRYIYLYLNALSGVVPLALLEDSRLVSFSVSQNMLSGGLSPHVNSSLLSFFDVSDNIFTGALPSFNASSSLTSAVFGVNCMHTTIPESYCQLHSLETLVLNGLNSAAGCHGNEDNSFHVFGLQPANRRSGISGGLPSCLFNISSLRTLLASGNGIVGTLPDDMTGTNLTTLDLSHNALAGTIPSWMWMHLGWEELDLSFNRLTGHLATSVSFQSANTSLSLNINRLSGNIPSWARNMWSINVLNGNIFDCALDRSDVPPHDPYSQSYACGSVTVNSGLVVWGVVVLFGIVYVVVTKGPGSAGVFNVVRFLVGSGSDATATRVVFAEPLVQLCQWMTRCGLPFVLCCGMSLYAANSVYFSAYESKYVWTVSACFLSGWVPAVSMLVLFLLLLLLMQTSTASHTGKQSEPPVAIANRHQPRRSVSDATREEYLLIAVQYLLVLAIMVVVLGVNAAFVFALTQQDITLEAQLALTVSLSLFKIGCSWYTSHRLRWSVYAITQVLLRSRLDSSKRRQWLSSQGAQLTLSLNIFNNVVTPYCAEMLVNANCFLYMWSAVPATTSQYSTPAECFTTTTGTSSDTICPPSLVNTLTFHPTYSYSYLCSSSLVSTFSFVFLSRYLISGLAQVIMSLFVSPWVSARYSKMTERPPPSSTMSLRGSATVQTSADSDRSLVWRVLWYVLPFHDRPLQWFVDHYALDRSLDTSADIVRSQTESQTQSLEQMQPPSSCAVPTATDVNSLYGSGSVSSFSARDLPSVSPQLFSLARLLPSHKVVAVRTVTDLSLFATYGVLFPPLGLVIGCAVCLDVYVLVHYHMERARTLVRLCPHLQPELTAIEAAFDRLDKSVYGSLEWVSYLVAAFWSFTLFDTLGAEVGAVDAVWIVVVMCTAPGWMRGLVRLCRVIRGYAAMSSASSGEAAGGGGSQEVAESRATITSGRETVDIEEAVSIDVANPLVSSSLSWRTSKAETVVSTAMSEASIELNAVDTRTRLTNASEE